MNATKPTHTWHRGSVGNYYEIGLRFVLFHPCKPDSSARLPNGGTVTSATSVSQRVVIMYRPSFWNPRLNAFECCGEARVGTLRFKEGCRT